jgi:hypothetical protein
MLYEQAAIVACPGLRVFPDSKPPFRQAGPRPLAQAVAHVFEDDAVPSYRNMVAWHDRYGWVQDGATRQWKHAWTPKYVRVNDAHAFAAVCAEHDLGANEVLTADRQCYPFMDLEFDGDMDAARTLEQACRVMLQALTDVGIGGDVTGLRIVQGSRPINAADAAEVNKYPGARGHKHSYHVIFRTARPLQSISDMAALTPRLQALIEERREHLW